MIVAYLVQLHYQGKSLRYEETQQLMTQTSTIGQILSAVEVGLLPYMQHQLESEEFSQLRPQLSFQAEETRTQLRKDSNSSGLQTTLSTSLTFVFIPHTQFSPDEATLLALELQEILEDSIIHWSQHHPELLEPIAEIIGSFSGLEEVRYQGGYLPGFSLKLKFALSYNPTSPENKDSAEAQVPSTQRSQRRRAVSKN